MVNNHRQKVTAYLGLGTNLGNKKKNLQEALRLLRQHVTVRKVSSFYDTTPVGYTAQDNFINAVCEVTTSLSPGKLLVLVKNMEKNMGRVPNFINGPRIIDIDILLYNNQIINTSELIIPHSRMIERAFVLIPLAEIAPELIHPVNKTTIRELLEKLGKIEGINRI
jgi:2-amino-4-hydroxy-6-hydroxymethyldihydropteridine diphosphokinase